MAQIIVGSILILLIVLLFGSIFKKMIDPDAEGNTIWACPNCDITTRKMALQLFNKNSDDPNWKRMKCPHCDSIGGFDRDNSRAAPLSPKLSLKERINIHKALIQGEESVDADKQMKKYVELQEAKLKKVQEEMRNEAESSERI